MGERLLNIIWTFCWTSCHNYYLLNVEETLEIIPNRCSLDDFRSIFHVRKISQRSQVTTQLLHVLRSGRSSDWLTFLPILLHSVRVGQQVPQDLSVFYCWRKYFHQTGFLNMMNMMVTRPTFHLALQCFYSAILRNQKSLYYNV